MLSVSWLLLFEQICQLYLWS